MEKGRLNVMVLRVVRVIISGSPSYQSIGCAPLLRTIDHSLVQVRCASSPYAKQRPTRRAKVGSAIKLAAASQPAVRPFSCRHAGLFNLCFCGRKRFSCRHAELPNTRFCDGNGWLNQPELYACGCRENCQHSGRADYVLTCQQKPACVNATCA